MVRVLITGAGKGLGTEFVRQFAADGAEVHAAVQFEEQISALSSLSSKVSAHVLDVCDRAALKNLANKLEAKPVDILICNAGIFGPKGLGFGETNYPFWEDIFRTNVLGTMATIEAFAPLVSASNRKLIIIMSSRLGSITLNDGGDLMYRSSKAALNQVAKTTSLWLAKHGVSVVALSPGHVRTDMGGAAAPITPEQSITALRAIIKRLTLADSGKFIAHTGQENPW